MMLKDFSEVDQYLIDPKYLFHYIHSFKTIDEDSELSPEQNQLLKQFWDTLPSDENADIRKNFIKTWSALSDIYNSFKSELIKRNAAYEGMAYSALLDHLESNKKNFTKRILCWLDLMLCQLLKKDCFVIYLTTMKQKFFGMPILTI
ncbi:MAG: hypothetical protein R2728_01455 [Chitinophagales bacterium]